MPASPALSSLLIPVRLNRYIPIVPTPKQMAFLALTCSEALYGGAAGGGKSFALLAAALQYVDVPGYHAVLIRRSLSHLNKPGALISLSREWLGPTDAEYRERDHVWYFPSGATLSFGFLEHEGDLQQYQGGAYHFLGFDELTQMEEHLYTYLFSRRRRALDMTHIPTRFRAATNPGGNEEWVHRRFIIDGPKDGRAFVPASAKDNPHLDQEDYASALSEMSDVVERERLTEGTWGLLAQGTKFNPAWFRLIDQLPRGTQHMRFVRYWDLAAAEPSTQTKDPDWTVGVLMGEYHMSGTRGGWDEDLSPEGVFYIADIKRFRLIPHSRDAQIRLTAETDPLGTLTVIEEPPGIANQVTQNLITKVLRGYNARLDKANGAKHARADALSSAAAAGNVRILRRDWTTPFLKECGAFPWGGHDDQVDAASGAHKMLTHNSGVRRQSLDVITRDEITRRNLDRRPWRVA